MQAIGNTALDPLAEDVGRRSLWMKLVQHCLAGMMQIISVPRLQE
jgi:hypothetical protein